MSKREELARAEVEEVELGDARLDRRFGQLMEMMSRRPEQSFPGASGDSDAALEATYRFLSNESVSYEALLAPHQAKTLERMKADKEALVLHDTTEFRFEGDREGLGRLQRKQQGFMGHFALAVSADGRRRAFGVLGLLPVIRPWELTKTHWRTRYHDPRKESLRWTKLVDDVAVRAKDGPSLIHVMDREADSFGLLSHMIEQDQRMIIRVKAEQRWTTSGVRVGDATQGIAVSAERDVGLSIRKAQNPKGAGKSTPRPARNQRTAKLQVRACPVELLAPDRSKAAPITMNLVHVTEVETPEGQEPVDWKLYTTDSIETVDQILLIVDRYRSRWVIEEFFKAIKTGCAYEKRQLGTKGALLNALALFIPIAWTLLVLRQECRDERTVPSALTSRQMQVLRAVLRKPLPQNPTAREILLSIAALGGHIKNNGDPGWQVLGRGFEKLLAYEVGWSAATRDQS